MINNSTDHLSEQRKEQLRKEQRTIRKIGIILLILAVILMPIFSMIHFGLVAVPAISATIGGFLVARSYIHIKYQNIDQQK